MYIEKINWLDKEEKEAILEIANNSNKLICFSYPCLYNVGMTLTEPLECLDTEDIILASAEVSNIENIDGAFKYRLTGQLKDIKNGIIEVYGFILHIDEKIIPRDIVNGQFVQFNVTRIDVF